MLPIILSNYLHYYHTVMAKSNCIIAGIITIIVSTACYSTMAPIWIPSNALKAFSLTWVNVLGGTSHSQASQAYLTVPYPSGITFASPPQLTMAVIRYEADSSLLGDFMILFNTAGSASTTSFEVTHLLTTPVWIIVYRCIALDTAFSATHHLNLFSNVVVQSVAAYASTTAVSVSVDYTALATSYGYTFTTFAPVNGSDYSQNKIVVFVSCFGYYAGAASSAIVQVSARAVDASHFSVDFLFGNSITIDRYHANLIVYDKGTMESSGLFKFHHHYLNFTDVAGGEHPVPPEYQDSAIMGWTDVSASSSSKFVSFNVTFSNLSSPTNVSYGITMLPPVPVNAPTNQPAQRVGISLFYIQYLICTNSSYFLDAVNQICIQCSYIAHCQQCSSGTNCTTCEIGYFVNSTNLCEQYLCSITNCTVCLNSTSCYLCDYTASSYLDSSLSCLLCDNAVNMYINMSSSNKQCLDCNVVICDFLSNPQLITIEKEGCNGFVISIKDQRMSLASVSSLAKFINAGVQITHIEESQTAVFSIHATYSVDLIDQQIILQLMPGKYVNATYNPTPPALFYSEQECAVGPNVHKLLRSYAFSGYAILGVSLFSAKIIGLELFGVLQLSYFALAEQSFLNLYLAPMLDFKLVNEQGAVPKNLQDMKIASSFLNNCNIMLLLFYVYLGVVGVVCLISNLFCPSMQKCRLYSTRAFKQGMITLVLFNCFNFAFSAGVHWKHSSKTDDLHAFSSVLSILIFVVVFLFIVGMQITEEGTFGEFKNKFKASFESQAYISVSILYRIALGIFCALKNDYKFSSLFMLGLSIAFLLYVLVNLPFKCVYHNYRAATMHATTLIIILVANYYRTMKSNTPLSVKGRIHAPAILQLAMMGVCIVVSFAVLVRETVATIKKCCKSSSNKIAEDSFEYDNRVDKSNMQFNPTEQNMAPQAQ